MDHSTTQLLTELRTLLTELGDNGGLIGPSVYDTAQVLRYAPPPDTWPVVAWLLDRQLPDGGWGDPTVPRARDVPSLAAILALRAAAPEQAGAAIAAGLAFLREQGRTWRGPLPEDIPVAIELLLPALLQEAEQYGIAIDSEPYAELIRLGQVRRHRLAGRTIAAGTTPSHSWEALMLAPDISVIDGSGGVGHSPAATAAWLHATSGRDDLACERAEAVRFLKDAGESTGTGIPGVMPTVWPVTNFERIWVLYTLHLSSLLRHRMLRAFVEPQVEHILRALRPEGLGMSPWFTADGDITATTLAMLAGAGHLPDLRILQRFAKNDSGGYSTYFGELQYSISATAHAMHAISMLRGDPSASLAFLMKHRLPDKTWAGDKWHTSWLYLTSHIMAALCAAGRADLALESMPTLLERRRADGSWGVQANSIEDTAYAVLALLTLDRAGVLPPEGRAALESAADWMARHDALLLKESRPYWIGKELYRPHRIVRASILSAMLGCAIELELERVA